MTQNEAQKIISIGLKNINDKAFENALRQIIFENNIDWENAIKIIENNMPETIDKQILV